MKKISGTNIVLLLNWHKTINMKSTLIFAIFFLFTTTVFAQNLDLIVTQNGDSIACKIDSISGQQLFFKIKTQRSNWVSTFYAIERISDYKYNFIPPKLYKFKKGTSVILEKRSEDNFRYLKSKYDYKSYRFTQGDKYSPQMAFAASALLPGLGHLYVGEPLIGLYYLGAVSASTATFVLGFAMAWQRQDGAGFVMLSGLITWLTFYTANLVSSARMAKVKNMHLNHKNLSFQFTPDIKIENNRQLGNSLGLNFSICF